MIARPRNPVKFDINILKGGSTTNMDRQELWRKLKKGARDQRGFTLIELLVVIAIMGILAAVVTMSMVGITKIAQGRAAASELQTVQVAYDTMLADQGVDPGKECQGAAAGASDMTAWPSNGKTFDTSAAHVPAHVPVPLAPYYLRQGTHGTYTCSGNGSIAQVTYNP